jgi:hypothetical protein
MQFQNETIRHAHRINFPLGSFGIVAVDYKASEYRLPCKLSINL